MRLRPFALVVLTVLPVGAPALAASIDDRAAALAALFPAGRHGHWTLAPSPALALVKAFVRETTDAATFSAYRFVSEAPALDTDAALAGTLAPGAAARALAEALADADDGPLRLAQATALTEGIAAAGGRFGFDASWQNGCAVPTPFLLVLDEQAGTVAGIDLAPCVE